MNDTDHPFLVKNEVDDKDLVAAVKYQTALFASEEGK
jgi:hypothetical protein